MPSHAVKVSLRPTLYPDARATSAGIGHYLHHATIEQCFMRLQWLATLARGPACCRHHLHLVVFAVETGGRCGPEPASAHAAVRSALRAAYVSRWSGIIAVAAQRALASSLLELPLDTVASAAGEPAVHEVLQDERWLRLPAASPRGPRPPTCLVACRCTLNARVTVAKSVCEKNSRSWFAACVVGADLPQSYVDGFIKRWKAHLLDHG